MRKYKKIYVITIFDKLFYRYTAKEQTQAYNIFFDII